MAGQLARSAPMCFSEALTPIKPLLATTKHLNISKYEVSWNSWFLLKDFFDQSRLVKTVLTGHASLDCERKEAREKLEIAWNPKQLNQRHHQYDYEFCSKDSLDTSTVSWLIPDRLQRCSG
jgi:hypothetical protein